jgi:hypothetical protein
MQTIKFRSYDVKEKAFLFIEYNHNTQTFEILNNNKISSVDGEREDLEQLVKVVNGVEIYIGDYVDCDTYHNNFKMGEKLFQVDELCTLSCNSTLKNFRVLGNIHENPELKELVKKCKFKPYSRRLS